MVFNKDMQWVARLSIFMLLVAFRVINVLRCHYIALTPGCSTGHCPSAALTVPFISDRNCYILWPLSLNYQLLFLADCYIMLVGALLNTVQTQLLGANGGTLGNSDVLGQC